MFYSANDIHTKHFPGHWTVEVSVATVAQSSLEKIELPEHFTQVASDAGVAEITPHTTLLTTSSFSILNLHKCE